MSWTAKPSSLAVSATSKRAGKFLAAQIAIAAYITSSVIVQSFGPFSPNSEVGEHARHGRGGTRLTSRTLHDAIQSAGLELF